MVLPIIAIVIITIITTVVIPNSIHLGRRLLARGAKAAFNYIKSNRKQIAKAITAGLNIAALESMANSLRTKSKQFESAMKKVEYYYKKYEYANRLYKRTKNTVDFHEQELQTAKDDNDQDDIDYWTTILSRSRTSEKRRKARKDYMWKQFIKYLRESAKIALDIVRKFKELKKRIDEN